ncbi:MaoC family dehydratase N-terminal domain-containing protein [Variovorax sp. J22R24]|uniref:FAS1-like dehydratase domain-containing protein n=1 Tax=Variovorax gracilis TaxID=3053502 RepID=UPI0025774508|nr:MaoC family dehydratase N-terminal domain-containing protein [Variovorax sp. J22R24]MDM0109467.1 MaoC family dehydratase N-terminal domain-containing protein [Variovorax sp. J22R24]
MNDFNDWIGRTETTHARIDPHSVAAMGATLDATDESRVGDALAPGWHWLFFNPVVAQSALGEDGHPRRDVPGSFLPPIPLPRRMWAASRIRYLTAIAIGSEAIRTSRILRITPKEGRSGSMCFVTVAHTTTVDDQVCVVEEQDIVYREAAAAPAPRPAEAPADAPIQWRESHVPNTTLLFRYSALTFNGHRIHYDQPYAQDVEFYRGLVVHGPLTATLLQQFARRCKPALRLASFEFKGVSPLYCDEPMELQAWDMQSTGELHLRAVNGEGASCMEAVAKWSRCEPRMRRP